VRDSAAGESNDAGRGECGAVSREAPYDDLEAVAGEMPRAELVLMEGSAQDADLGGCAFEARANGVGGIEIPRQRKGDRLLGDGVTVLHPREAHVPWSHTQAPCEPSYRFVGGEPFFFERDEDVAARSRRRVKRKFDDPKIGSGSAKQTWRSGIRPEDHARVERNGTKALALGRGKRRLSRARGP
jgi:hypothetical protein